MISIMMIIMIMVMTMIHFSYDYNCDYCDSIKPVVYEQSEAWCDFDLSFLSFSNMFSAVPFLLFFFSVFCCFS